MSEQLAGIIAAAKAHEAEKPKPPQPCAWCNHGMAMVNCTCTEVCAFSDCWMVTGRRWMDLPGTCRETYGMPQFVKEDA